MLLTRSEVHDEVSSEKNSRCTRYKVELGHILRSKHRLGHIDNTEEINLFPYFFTHIALLGRSKRSTNRS